MDKTEIVEILKEEGLEVSEELAVSAVRGAFRIIQALLPKLNPVVAIVVNPLLSQLEPMILDLIDKIDGKDNPGY